VPICCRSETVRAGRRAIRFTLWRALATLSLDISRGMRLEEVAGRGQADRELTSR
jgi:hypothetical protein